MNTSLLRKNKQGFTLLEVLLVVAIIAILAGIVIVALNPGKQLGDTRNSQRKADVNTILSAIYQFSIDNNGNLPSTMPASTLACGDVGTEICKEGVAAATCTTDSLIYLGVLTDQQKYLTAIPTDPSASATNGSHYYVSQSANKRVTVCAPVAVSDGAPAAIAVTK